MSPDDSSQNAHVKWLQNKAIGGTSCEPATLIGASDHVAFLKRITETIGCTEAMVLITGESGTGKELVARRIHSYGMRRHHAFVPVNCGAIPDSLFESEVFGFEKGAFTGACARRAGYILQADKGTLFLDEVGELSLTAQTKLLRVLEDRQVRRIGARTPEAVNVRFVAATNRDLAQMVAAGEFREDLFYRLAVIQIHLLPLRRRREDIVPMAIDFLNRLASRYQLPRKQLTADAAAHLELQLWRGNARELRNVLERAFVLSASQEIAAADLLLDPARETSYHAKESPAAEAIRLRSALEATWWNKSQAAQVLRWSRMKLYRKMELYGIEPVKCKCPVTENKSMLGPLF